MDGSRIAMPMATNYLPGETAAIIEAGWRDFCEHFPVMLQESLHREFSPARPRLSHITVLSAKTRQTKDVDGEVGVAGTAACVEEFKMSVGLQVSGAYHHRTYVYRRGLVEYDGNRTGGYRLDQADDSTP